MTRTEDDTATAAVLVALFSASAGLRAIFWQFALPSTKRALRCTCGPIFRMDFYQQCQFQCQTTLKFIVSINVPPPYRHWNSSVLANLKQTAIATATAAEIVICFKFAGARLKKQKELTRFEVLLCKQEISTVAALCPFPGTIVTISHLHGHLKSKRLLAEHAMSAFRPECLRVFPEDFLINDRVYESLSRLKYCDLSWPQKDENTEAAEYYPMPFVDTSHLFAKNVTKARLYIGWKDASVGNFVDLERSAQAPFCLPRLRKLEIDGNPNLALRLWTTYLSPSSAVRTRLFPALQTVVFVALACDRLELDAEALMDTGLVERLLSPPNVSLWANAIDAVVHHADSSSNIIKRMEIDLCDQKLVCNLAVFIGRPHLQQAVKKISVRWPLRGTQTQAVLSALVANGVRFANLTKLYDNSRLADQHCDCEHYTNFRLLMTLAGSRLRTVQLNHLTPEDQRCLPASVTQLQCASVRESCQVPPHVRKLILYTSWERSTTPQSKIAGKNLAVITRFDNYGALRQALDLDSGVTLPAVIIDGLGTLRLFLHDCMRLKTRFTHAVTSLSLCAWPDWDKTMPETCLLMQKLARLEFYGLHNVSFSPCCKPGAEENYYDPLPLWLFVLNLHPATPLQAVDSPETDLDPVVRTNVRLALCL